MRKYFNLGGGGGNPKEIFRCMCDFFRTKFFAWIFSPTHRDTIMGSPMVLIIRWYCKTPCAQMYPPFKIHPCPRYCPRIRMGEAMIYRLGLMIANYYQCTFTIIQSNFGGFLHYKDIIQQKQRNIILNQNNDMLNYSKCTLRTVGYP